MKLSEEKRQEAIETLQNMLDAECLVVGHMAAEGETDIDRRVLRALTAGLNALKGKISYEG